MKTGFLIINYNDCDTTMHLIDNIRNYKCIDKIVVLDNCSTDNSFLKLSKKYASQHIHVIKSKTNNGYAYGMNFGCKYLMEIFGECNIIISNADIEIDSEKIIVELISYEETNQAIVAPVIVGHDNEVDRGWKIPSPIIDVILNLPYIHRYLKPKLLGYSKSFYSNRKFVEVEIVLGCFFMIKSSFLKRVDFFDENTFLYYEENIIGKKLKEIGAKTFVNNTISVFHNHSVSIDKSINHMNKYNILKESQYYFQCKYNKANLIERFLLRFTSRMSYFIIKAFR